MSPQDLFWTGQEIYIHEVFLPVIIGILIFTPLLVMFFAYGFGTHWRLWRLGQKEDRSGNWIKRLGTTLSIAIANVRIIRAKELYPGLMHLLLFGGAVILFLGKFIRLFSFITGLTNPPQSIYVYASLASEIAGVVLVIGAGLAVYRRYVLRPPRLDNKPDDSLIYVFGGLVVLTGFMIKGYRIAIADITPTDWLEWSPVGYLLSHVFPTFMTEAKNEILVWHRTVIHAIPGFLFLGYIWFNRSRLQHIIISPINIYFRSLKPKGAINAVDFEKTELYGVSKIESFTWKQLVDLDACTRCGRCQDACPAYFSGKKLNPKQVILNLREHMYEVYPVPLSTKPREPRKDMITEAITDEVIWDCTTCRACQQACPVYIEHVDKIIDMRRNLAMERSQLPEAAQEALKCLGTRWHPFRGSTLGRTDWTDGLGIKPLAEKGDVDVLYWVGCTAALEERNVRVARATARIMQAAGINFGILGDEEMCCGDPARRMGDEYLYQTICKQNVEILNGYKVKKIVTACPHCFNNLSHEYSQFGGNFEVIHHTRFISDLVASGKIKPAALANQKVAYHDSCYLGRYNDIYDAPRSILKAIGIYGTELGRHGTTSFCCGGGGGHMWMEEDPAKRVNVRRVDEIINSGVSTVATACPYCLTMFEDGIKAKGAEETLHARDLSEMVAEALGQKDK